MQTKRAEWADRIERWQASGLSGAEFGAATGVSAKALQNWKWRLGSVAKETKLAERQAFGGRASFVEVVGPMLETKAACEGPIAGERMEVVLPSGLRIWVAAGFDGALLRRLVETLKGL